MKASELVLIAADELIEALKVYGHNYSDHRNIIAEELFMPLLEAIYDVSQDFDGLPSIRLIQEDAFDQDDGPWPSYSEQKAYIAHIPAYVFFT